MENFSVVKDFLECFWFGGRIFFVTKSENFYGKIFPKKIHWKIFPKKIHWKFFLFFLDKIFSGLNFLQKTRNFL